MLEGPTNTPDFATKYYSFESKGLGKPVKHSAKHFIKMFDDV